MDYIVKQVEGNDLLNTENVELQQLSEIQLALIGGGCGEVVFG